MVKIEIKFEIEKGVKYDDWKKEFEYLGNKSTSIISSSVKSIVDNEDPFGTKPKKEYILF